MRFCTTQFFGETRPNDVKRCQSGFRFLLSALPPRPVQNLSARNFRLYNGRLFAGFKSPLELSSSHALKSVSVMSFLHHSEKE